MIIPNSLDVVVVILIMEVDDEKAQTANFSVLARVRRPHKELLAKNMKN